jgi:exodeoxyribonuclease V alpha subunit
VSSSEEASPRPDQLPVEHLQGIVERVTFHSEESGYTVLRFNMPGERELVTVIGSFPEIHAGQTLRLTGYYREHPKYGRQFQCFMLRRPSRPPSPAWRNTWAVGSSKGSAL